MEDVEISAENLRVVEYPGTPTHLVTGIRGLFVSDGMITINFVRLTVGTPKTEHEGPHEEAVAKIAMPVNAFMRIAKFFGEHSKALIEDGAIAEVSPEDLKKLAENGPDE